MDIKTNSNILYPQDVKLDVKLDKSHDKKPLYYEVPHKAYRFCQKELDDVFSKAGNFQSKYIFILCPLHKGKVFYDDPFKIYSYEDCFVNHPLVEKNDIVCSEEYSYEILLPYLKAYFKASVHTAFYAPEKSEKLRDFICYLKENYKDSLFFISNNETNCAQMWKEAF